MSRESTQGFIMKAKNLSDAGKFEAAIQVLQTGLSLYPNYVSARVLLGDVYWSSGDAMHARNELEQVIKAVPDNFAAHRKLAMIYRHLGDYEAGIRSCEAVLHANPKDQEMRTWLGEFQQKLPHTPLEASEAYPAAHTDAGVSFDERTMNEISAAPSEGTAGPEDGAIASETLAELYIAQGHREKGLAVYRNLAMKSPDNLRLTARIDALLNKSSKDDRVSEPSVPSAPHLLPSGLNSRMNRMRRLEGWLQIVRARRRM